MYYFGFVNMDMSILTRLLFIYGVNTLLFVVQVERSPVYIYFIKKLLTLREVRGMLKHK